MPERPERQFRLPHRPRDPWWLWLLVAALHVPLIALVVIEFHRHGMTTTHGEPPTVAFQPAFRRGELPAEAPNGAPLVGNSATPRRAPHTTPAADHPTPGPAVMAPPPVPPVSVASTDTGGSAPVATSYLRPSYGSGRLWIKPLPMTPDEIARALAGKSRAQLDDSVVSRIVQTYLDEMAEENRINMQSPPRWTTTIGGKTVGLDQRWIYLGPIKIPAALLALLPLHLQANPTEYQFNQRLQQMRSDLFEAARRSATYDDFKDAVKDLRTETERRREFQKAQRTAPADSGLRP